ncbi:MAG: ABC transporter ATP-binding protein/permease [Defluviitaleaceae bacterium]|nr:ABC transporter ATP-binding protein/permease [Defluviitaleaceae bacterium]
MLKKENEYANKVNDMTSDFENAILKEKTPKLIFLVKLFKYVFSSAKIMCGIFLSLSIFLSISQPIATLIWQRYIDSAHNYSDIRQPRQLILIFGLAIVYWLIRFVNTIIDRYIYGHEEIERLSKVQELRLQEKFQEKLFTKISKLYPEYMEVPMISDMISNNFNSMASERSSLQKGIIIDGFSIIAKSVSLIMIAASLYMFNPFLCLIIIIAPIPTLYTTYIGNKLKHKLIIDSRTMLREAEYYENLIKDISVKEIKTMNLFSFFFFKWKTVIDNYSLKERKNQFYLFLLGIFNSVISNSVNVIAIAFAILLMMQGRLSIGALSAIMILVSTIVNNTSVLFTSIANFISKKNEASKFFDFIDLDEQNLKNEAHFKDIIDMNILDVKNVSYRYPLTHEYRINKVNFTMKKGEKLAFIGENGAGKTTFVKLITGMLEPSIGEILINGEKSKDINYTDKYNSISAVFQDPARFNSFTIGENVFLGDVDKTCNEDEIDIAMEFAGLTNINKNTLLGKDINGTDLSGGQWQKTALARAYYRNRNFIVLDEPTSNLDPFIESEILEKYIKMTKDKTVIIITHRISAASLADRIVVFKNGKIIEDGKHEQLLSLNGEYAKLYYTQMRLYERTNNDNQEGNNDEMDTIN